MNNNFKAHLYNDKFIIAGPCALEHRTQLKNTVRHLASMGVRMIRASLWKPRSNPNWDGIGFWGIYALLEETVPYGLVPATEIMNADHARLIVEALKVFDEDAKIILWIGARNQNHFEQKAIARLLADSSPNILLMCKNQMWEDKKHWIGIYEHILAVNFPKDRLLACHRGFAPGKAENAEGYRNLPDFGMAFEVKEAMDIPMVIDPSHIGGSQGKVFKILAASLTYHFDGYMVEVHDSVKDAKTDGHQQLSIDEFYEFLEQLKAPQEEYIKAKLHGG